MTHDLPSILAKYGVDLRKSGTGFVAKCIAHEDNNPSMSVYVNGNGKYTTHCHSCGFHEDAIGVVAHMENVSMAEAMKILGEDTFVGHGEMRGKIEVRKPQRICSAPPADAGRPRMDYLIDRDTGECFGDPEEVFVYRTPDGGPWYYEARFIVNGKKQPRVFTWGQREGQEPKWECAHYTGALRPLYGLDALAAKPKAQIVVCEGPRKAKYAQGLLPKTACIGWSGGSSSWSKSDWAAITESMVIIWPDNDDAGRKCANEIAKMLIAQNNTVYILDVTEMPEGWDAADAAADGWTTKKTIEWCKAHKGHAIERHIPELPAVEVPPLEAYEHCGITWQLPLDIFASLQAPRIEAAMIPECMIEWVYDLEGVKGVDAGMMAFTAIIASASLLHDKIKLQPEANNPTWKESARLWGAIVGDPSVRKSPAMIEGLREIKRIDDELCEKEKAQKYKNMLAEKVHAQKEKEYLAALGKGENPDMPAPPELVQVDRVLIQSTTIEAVEEAAKTCDRGFLVDRDELVGWFGSMDAYKNRAGSDRAAWLELYNGGPRRVDRIQRGSFRCENWSACLIGAIQPGPMRELAGQINEDGLLQRFMIVLAHPAKEGNEQTPNHDAARRVYAMHRQIFGTQATGETITLTPEANAIRKEIVKKSFELVQNKFISASFCSHMGKWDGLAARLMLTYHAIECADKQIHPQAVQVSADTAERVRAFMMGYLLPNAIVFYDEILTDDAISQAVRAVGRLILVKPDLVISLRDVLRGWTGFRYLTPIRQDQVMQRLVDAAWLLPDPVAKINATKNRPIHYLINPKIAEIHEARIAGELERRRQAREFYALLKRGDRLDYE